MKVHALIERLRELPADLDVEVLADDGDDSREVDAVSVREVTRGVALPNPRTYSIVVLGSGWEGL